MNDLISLNYVDFCRMAETRTMPVYTPLSNDRFRSCSAMLDSPGM